MILFGPQEEGAHRVIRSHATNEVCLGRRAGRTRHSDHIWPRAGLRWPTPHSCTVTPRMASPLICPHCGNDRVLRIPRERLVDLMASLLLLSPFHCGSCHRRFLAYRLGRSVPWRFVERRQHLRIPVRLFLSFSGGRIRGEGIVLDLSMGGCMIHSEAQVHVDDIFYLQIALDDGEAPLEVAAMVRSVTARGIAFKFLRAAQENKRLLAFVQARSGEPVRKP